jgi:hypothetical protein
VKISYPFHYGGGIDKSVPDIFQWFVLIHIVMKPGIWKSCEVGTKEI